MSEDEIARTVDPKFLDEIDRVKARADEWSDVHKELCKGELRKPQFFYTRREFDDDSEEIIVSCYWCGCGEIVGYKEPVPGGYEWSVVRQEPLN